MNFSAKDLLEAIGPNATLIFAAWIFLSFLQQRYLDAYEHYRQLIEEYRKHGAHDRRRHSLADQILQYKRRCELMRLSTNIGVVSAILLIAGLIAAGLEVIAGAAFLKYVTAVCALVGLAAVIAAAVIVLMENTRLQGAIESDVSDIEDLRGRAGVASDGSPRQPTDPREATEARG